MENSGNIDLLAAFKTLMAENKSQAARLEEYTKIIDSRDSEIDMLQTMLSDANEYRSNTDNQLRELKDLQRYINDLQQHVAGSIYMSTGKLQQTNEDNVAQQLQDLNREYTYLQTQLTDLQTQLQDVNSRNLLLQQQTGRIAELESLLENAGQETGKLTSKTVYTGKK